jgi:GNAT superfamily N-acetyltransferase
MTPAGDIIIDDDPARVDVEWVWAFLSADAYWGRWRTRADLEAQLTAAWRVVGAYERATGRQVGFARAVSDGVALGYLADVFVAAGSRGRGIGQALVAEIVDTEPGRRFRWLLHTADAHPLYARFGFRAPDPTCLERPRPSQDQSSGADRS